MNEPLLAFLLLAQKELGGSDARAEIGGRPPRGERVVCYEAEGEFRIVVVFDEPPADPIGLRRKLAELARGFLQSAAPPSVRPSRPLADDSVEARLEQALVQLVERAGARVAAVIDRTSPQVWGSTLPPHAPSDAEMLMEVAKHAPSDQATEPQLIGRAISLIRSEQDHEDGLFIEEGNGFVLRWFAGIYCLVVAFDREVSELRVESSVIRALPYVEKLVLSLPPLEPEPQGGRKVIRMPFRLV